MGQAQSALRAVAATAHSSPREALFVAWVAYSLALQARSAASAKEAEADGGATVCVSRKGVKKVFSETRGGRVDLGWAGAGQFWISTLIRAYEAGLMVTMGHAFFAPRENGMNSWHRFRNIMFAAFALLPALDLAVPEDWANPRKEDQRHSHHKLDAKFRLPLYVWTLLELFATYRGIAAVVRPGNKLSRKEVAGIMGYLMIMNGAVGINTAHELLHKPVWLEKLLGYMLLCNVNYMHWGEEHLSGHHEHVATPLDPASARSGESLYEFLPRTVVGSWRSAWRLEQARLTKAGLPFWRNRMVLHAVLPLLWGGAIAKLSGGGLRALKLFYLQGLGSALLLEIVNYIEHYGLSRDKLPDGTYEPVNPTHSWNAPHRLSNAFLYKLQRHSDHHTYAMRPYHLLRNFAESPQLPTGYPGMVVLALCPPLFRWVMDPLVAAAKVTPENYANEEGAFKKDDRWRTAERVAKAKVAGITLSGLAAATWAMRASERARLRRSR